MAAPVDAQEHAAGDARTLMREDFEQDADGDSVPDGWYNLRDATWVSGAGPEGKRIFRFECERAGRPARASRAFGVDGREHEALVLSLWVKPSEIGPGERTGEEPGLLLEFFDGELKPAGRGRLGPWTTRNLSASTWTQVSRWVPVPEATRDVILTLGLLGASGQLEVDGLKVVAIPRGGIPTTNLIWNGSLALGDPTPWGWSLEGSARRVSSTETGNSWLELTRGADRAMISVAGPLPRSGTLRVETMVRCSGMRAGGLVLSLFALDARSQPIPGEYQTVWTLGGTIESRKTSKRVQLPAAAQRVVLQFDKRDAAGVARIDEVAAYAEPSGAAGIWTPGQFRVVDSETWPVYEPADAIEPDSALDASALVKASGAADGRVSVRDGHFVGAQGHRVNYFGVVALPTLAFADADRVEPLADRLVRSGVNHVRFDTLDGAFGPGVSLYDDSRDDTSKFDPTAMERFDRVRLALARRGISYSFELISGRLFRPQDGLARGLPAGGGPAVGFDPAVRSKVISSGEMLLDHRSGAGAEAVKDDPALAWIAITGEQSLFDLLEGPGGLPAALASALRSRVERSGNKSRLSAWKTIESQQWSEIVSSLRAAGCKVPIAGSSHWRREAEFNQTQAAAGLDLVDDRLFWSPPEFALPEQRGLISAPIGDLLGQTARKRRPGMPIIVSQFAGNPNGQWALPYEGADLALAAWGAAIEDWDGLIRRGIFLHPRRWGAAVPGTSGGDDLLAIPGVVNANPALFGIMPHAASLVLRGLGPESFDRSRLNRELQRTDRILIDSPWTQGIVGSAAGRVAGNTRQFHLELETPGAVVLVSSLASEPIARSRRLLVTAVGRVEPTGARFIDQARSLVAQPGTPPIRVEPVVGRVVWLNQMETSLEAFRLDGSGKRIAREPIIKDPSGGALVLRGDGGQIHWEIVRRGG
jgi:hypothetical protein